MIAAAALMTTRMPHGECPMTAKVDFLLTVRMPISVENPRAEEYRRHLHRRGYGRQDRRGGSSPRPAKGLIPWRRRCCPGRITWTCRESSSTRRAAPRGELHRGFARGRGGRRGRNDVRKQSHGRDHRVDDRLRRFRHRGDILHRLAHTRGYAVLRRPVHQDHEHSDRTLYADGLMINAVGIPDHRQVRLQPRRDGRVFLDKQLAHDPRLGHRLSRGCGGIGRGGDNGPLDHTQYNANSIDLSNADFEYFNPLDDEDVDNPEVPNVICSFLEEGDYWTVHNRGFKSYALGRLGDGVTAESFAADYYYAPEYELVVPGFGSFPHGYRCLEVPQFVGYRRREPQHRGAVRVDRDRSLARLGGGRTAARSTATRPATARVCAASEWHCPTAAPYSRIRTTRPPTSPPRPCRRSCNGPWGDSVIVCRNLTHYYGERLIYKDLSFEVPRWRILGLLGKNGTGKTTAINNPERLSASPCGRVPHLRREVGGHFARYARAHRTADRGTMCSTRT